MKARALHLRISRLALIFSHGTDVDECHLKNLTQVATKLLPKTMKHKGFQDLQYL